MFIYEDFINKKVCKKLINFYENSNNKLVKNDKFTNMTELFLNIQDTNLQDYQYELSKILTKYKNKYIYVDKGQESWRLDEVIKIQKYEPGQSYFGWHAETSGLYENNNRRILAFSTFLNNIKKGGETEFFYQKQKIKPEEGKTILFPPFWTHTHKGNISDKNKYIITGWFIYG